MQTCIGKTDISSEELVKLLKEREEGKRDFLLVDVREDMEFKMGHIKGADLLKPTSTFPQWAQDLFNETQEKLVVFTCRTGSRSKQVQNIFKQNGHPCVVNHSGGIVSFRGDIEK
ncbi:MAG: hypothetical protein RLZZ428_270 [Pseudomonadota bacterium]|jgi:rhodanese-related sulfurtransferase